MPVYSYKCLKGHKFDRVCIVECRNFPKECPVCSSSARRLVKESMKGQTHKWVGRILEWGKPDIVVDREEDLLVEGQKPMTVIEG